MIGWVFALYFSVLARDVDLIPVIPSSQGLIADSTLSFALRKTDGNSYELVEVRKRAKTTGIYLSLNPEEKCVQFVRNKNWYVFYDPDLKQLRCYRHTQLKSFVRRNSKWKKEVLSKSDVKLTAKSDKNDAWIKAMDEILDQYRDQPIYLLYYPYRGSILNVLVDS